MVVVYLDKGSQILPDRFVGNFYHNTESGGFDYVVYLGTT